LENFVTLKHILITGGSGFVGSSIALFLKRDYPDSTVMSLDNLKRRGSELNISRLQQAGVTFVHGDIRCPEDLEATGRPDLIVECSAEPSVTAGLDGSPQYLVNTNLVGTVNCLELARRSGAAVIFLSTSRVYPIAALSKLPLQECDSRFELRTDASIPGISKGGVNEEFTLNGVRSIYGATKLASECLLQEYCAAYGIRGVINRCGVIAGPWQMGKVDQGFVALWVARHVLGGSLRYVGYGGTGKQVRDILHVADLYALIRKQIHKMDEPECRIYNIGGGLEGSVSLTELTRLVREATGRKIRIDAEPKTRIADIPYYVTDYTNAFTDFDWRPTRKPADIVEDVSRWMRDNATLLGSILS
jgi:CDP-paratose 2-epimerase